MVSLAELYKIAILLCPVFSSLFAILILLLEIRSSNRKSLKLNYYLIAYFFTVFLSWFSAVLYFYIPIIYVYINWMSMLAFMLMQIFFYGFIFEVTRTNEKEGISDFNYLFPVLLSLLLLVVSLVTPVSDQLSTILSKGVYKDGGPKLFFYLNYSKIVFRMIFNLIYTILGFKRLFLYRRFIKNFSSNEEKGALKWISTLFFFSMYLVLAPLFKITVSRDELVLSPIAIFFVTSLTLQYAYICLHVIKRDRYIIDLSNETSFDYRSNHAEEPFTLSPVNCKKVLPDEIEKNTAVPHGETVDEFRMFGEVGFAGKRETNEEEISPYLKKNMLTRDSFDAFMRIEKPYLNADLRITDLVDKLHVNRTYISSFINKEYGVNFSIFINKYRLQEYKVLKEMPEYCKMSKSELAEMAGFNSYRSFQRTEKEVAERKKE